MEKSYLPYDMVITFGNFIEVNIMKLPFGWGNLNPFSGNRAQVDHKLSIVRIVRF